MITSIIRVYFMMVILPILLLVDMNIQFYIL